MALLDVHGFRVALTGWPAVVERVALDFAWFRSEAGAPDRTVEIQEREPDYEPWAALRAAFRPDQRQLHRSAGERPCHPAARRRVARAAQRA